MIPDPSRFSRTKRTYTEIIFVSVRDSVYKVCNTYISSLVLTGMLDRAVMFFLRATLIRNGTLYAGSSKQGNTRRAKFGRMCVATNQRFSVVVGST